MAGRQFPDRPIDAQGSGDIPVGEVRVEALQVHVARHLRRCQKGLRLRREKQFPLSRVAIEQGLDPDTIPGKKKRPGRTVPQCEGKHAPKIVDTVIPVFFIKMDDSLRIAPGVKRVAFALQVSFQFRIVEDFPVEDDPDRPVLVVNRLLSSPYIDDGKPPHG